MISSCQKCKTKCCRTGPGPVWKKMKVHKYLDNFSTPTVYNRVCENFQVKTGHCALWGTPKLPVECRVYVCTTRSYTKKELSDIRAIARADCE